MLRFLNTEDRIVQTTKSDIENLFHAKKLRGNTIEETEFKWIWLIQKKKKFTYICKTKSGEFVEVYRYHTIGNTLNIPWHENQEERSNDNNISEGKVKVVLEDQDQLKKCY
jgi:hypothetical protein